MNKTLSIAASYRCFSNRDLGILKLTKCSYFALVVAFIATHSFAVGIDFNHKGMFAKEQLSADIALCGQAFYLPTVFGPTGMNGWIFDDALVVLEVENDSPADGVMLRNDAIVAINGKNLGSTHPLKAFGEEIESCEISGKMVLGILRDGKLMDVTIPMRKLGAYAKDWPFNCKKSRNIQRDACEYLARAQNFEGLFDGEIYLGFALNGLTWLASGDVKYLENARRLAYGYRNHFDPSEFGTVNWGWGYMGVFISEYYLQTGDDSVLPLLADIEKALERGQFPCGSWGHGPIQKHGYVQGGVLNNAGLGVFMSLILMREAGVPVDQEKFKKAYKFFSRFPYRGAVPYGDHRPEGGGGSNGKNGAAGICFSLLGDDEYSQYYARTITDTYPHINKGHTGGYMGFWLGQIQGSRTPHYPDYRRQVDSWRWGMDVFRRWDGGFLVPFSVIGKIYTSRGPMLSTGGLSLMYAMPDKKIRILGGKKGLFSRHNYSSEFKKAIDLYRDGDFVALRKMIKPDSPDNKELLRLADRKEEDIKLTMAKAEKALVVEGNFALAKALSLQIRRYTRGKANGLSRGFDWRLKGADGIGEYSRAQALYEPNKLLTYTDLEARQVFEEIAGEDNVGYYQGLARRELATPPEDSVWAFYSEMLHYGKAKNWQTDKKALAAKIRITGIPGGAWPRILALTELQKEGILGQQMEDWVGLAVSSEVNYPHPCGTWKVCSSGTIRSRDKKFKQPAWAGVKTNPQGWTEVDFDDSTWKSGVGPHLGDLGKRDPRFNNDTRKGIKTVAGRKFVRIEFDCDRTDFEQLMIGVLIKNEVAVGYLNGKAVLWSFATVGGRMNTTGLTMVRLPDSALKLLRKGKNVLAIELTGGNSFDFALYANTGKDPLTFKVREKSWRPGPKMAEPGTEKTDAYVAVKNLIKPCTTGLKFDPRGKPNADLDAIYSALQRTIEVKEKPTDRRGKKVPNPVFWPIEKRVPYLGFLNKGVREAAAQSLMGDGADAIPYILEALDSKDPRVLWSACRAIGGGYPMNGRGTPKDMTPDIAAPAVPKLVKLLDNKDMSVRAEALKALANCGKYAVPHYKKIASLSTDPDWWVREGVAHCLNYNGADEASDYISVMVDAYAKDTSYFGKRRYREAFRAVGQRNEKGGQMVTKKLLPIICEEDGFELLGDLAEIGLNSKTDELMDYIDKRIKAYQQLIPTLSLQRDVDNHKHFIKRLTEIKHKLDPALRPSQK